MEKAIFLQDSSGLVYVIFDSDFKKKYSIENNVNAFDLSKFKFVNLELIALREMKKVFLDPYNASLLENGDQQRFADMKKGQFFFWDGFINLKMEEFYGYLSLQITAFGPEDIVLDLKMPKTNYRNRKKQFYLMKIFFSEKNLF